MLGGPSIILAAQGPERFAGKTILSAGGNVAEKRPAENTKCTSFYCANCQVKY